MSEPAMTEPGCSHPDCVLDHPHAGPALLTEADQGVSRETSPKRTIGQIFEPEPVEVDEHEAAWQAERDAAAAQRRAEDTARLTEAEAANYAASHAIIEATRLDVDDTKE